MTVLFEDFICHIIELQSGARPGPEPMASKKRLSHFVIAHRTKLGKEAMARTDDPARKEIIGRAFKAYVGSAYKTLRHNKAAINMKKLQRKRELTGDRPSSYTNAMDKNE
jgi:hypothetical protein